MWELLQHWDQTLFLAINGAHCPWADRFVALFANKMTWGPMYVALLFALCKNRDWKSALAAVAAFLLLVVLSDQLTSHLIRPLVARPRPSRAEGLQDVVHLINGRRGGAFGFPSAHAANTAALAALVTLVYRHKLLSLFLVAWTLLTCHARVYAGVHYPGDVLAGVCLGVLVALLVRALYRKLLDRFPPLAPRGRPPLSLVAAVGATTALLVALHATLAP
ncbi:MAG: phosphatase PAP2 family protein [Odoribacteraceae bacterium]|jgi:undecaprenyl-diphosphatase|nr:phosphatase PAP2 family protein [Odoribacteraceae bacterium]